VWALRARRSPLRPLAWGALLYLSYVTWIGADYTLGRFLGAPLLCSLLALSWSVDLPALVSRAPRRWAAAMAVLLLLRIGTPWLERPISSYGIGDERRIYSPFTGLVNGAVAALADPGGPWPDHFWRIDGLAARERGAAAASQGGAAVEVFGYVGFYGYYAGPQVHIVDPHALTDPLLARLPGYVTETFNLPDRVDWRPGHLTRAIPPDYLETLRTGTPAFGEPEMRELWRRVELAHRAPLFAPGRAKALVGLALGSYRDELRAYVERHPEQFGIARP
jgi:arabinofuranosyltransferase